MNGTPASPVQNSPGPSCLVSSPLAPYSTVSCPPTTIISCGWFTCRLGTVKSGRMRRPCHRKAASTLVDRHIAPSRVAAMSTGAFAMNPPSFQ